MSKTGKAVLIASLLLGVIYFSLMSLAANGYGYMGYYGYHRGPSIWYWGGANTYYDRNVRSGSINGSRVRGGAVPVLENKDRSFGIRAKCTER